MFRRLFQRKASTRTPSVADGATRLRAHLEAAGSDKAAGSLEAALGHYEAALRIVTPDDAEIVNAMAIADSVGPERFRGRSSSPRTDAFDSKMRAEIVDILRHLGRFQEALHHASIAVYLDRFLGDRNNISASLHDLSLIQVALGNYNKAWRHFKESEAIDESLKEKGPAAQLDFRTAVRAGTLADFGFLHDALRQLESVIDRAENAVISSPVQLADVLNTASQCLQNLGEHVQAIDYLHRAIELQSRSSAHHPQLARLYRNLAIACHESRDFASAEGALSEIRKLPDRTASASAVQLEAELRLDRDRLEAWKRAGSRGPGPLARTHDVFISYNTADQRSVTELTDALTAFGLRTWTYRQFDDWSHPRPVDDIVRAVSEEVERSSLVVVVASGTSITSDYVFAEINHALSKDIPVVAWYPGGVRLVPQDASQRSTMTLERLLAIKERLMRYGIYSFFGYGREGRSVAIPAAGILKTFVALFPDHPAATSPHGRASTTAIDGTRRPPVLVGADEQIVAQTV